MSESKHTPGPWAQEEDTFFCRNIYDDGQQVCHISKQPMGGKILIACVAWRRNREEAKANASLIAACPVLLEACREALADLYAADAACPGDAAQERVRQLLLAAVAKAEGRQS